MNNIIILMVGDRRPSGLVFTYMAILVSICLFNTPLFETLLFP